MKIKIEIECDGQIEPFSVWLQPVDEASMLKSLEEKKEAFEILQQMMKEYIDGLTPAPNDIIDKTINSPVILNFYEYEQAINRTRRFEQSKHDVTSK